MGTKKCYACGENKDPSEFNKNCRKKDGLQTKCKECSRKISKRYYETNTDHRQKLRESNKKVKARIRRWVFDYLSQHPCVDCGEGNPIVLQFDHVRGQKIGCVSRMACKGSLTAIKKEVDKCEVRCANCHAIKTAKERGWYKWVRS